MCGIAGFITSEQSLKDAPAFIRSCLIAGAVRGVDASGIMQINSTGNLDAHKLPVCGSLFSQDPVAKQMIDDSDTAWATFVHNRHATTGKVDLAAAHPMTAYVEGDAAFSLMHNGTLKNWNQTKYVSDTHWAADRIKTSGPAAIKAMDGAYCFVWADMVTDPNIINIIRNKDRPLHMAFLKGGKTVLFASEAGMLFWLAERAGFIIDENTVLALEEDQLYAFDIKDPRNYTKTEVKQIPAGVTSNTAVSYADNKTSYDYQKKLRLIKDFKEAAAAARISMVTPPATFPANRPIAPVTEGLVTGPNVGVQQGACGSDECGTSVVVRDGLVTDLEDAEWEQQWLGYSQAQRNGNAAEATTTTVVNFPTSPFHAKHIDMARDAGFLGLDIDFVPVLFDPELNEFLGETTIDDVDYACVVLSCNKFYEKELDTSDIAACRVIGARHRVGYQTGDLCPELELILSKPFQTVHKSGTIVTYGDPRMRDNGDRISGTVRG